MCAAVSVLSAPLQPGWCECQSKKSHPTAGTAKELACLINSPLIWNLLAEQKLLHKSSGNLHSSSLSLITTDLTSSAGAAQPPTVLLRDAPPFPQAISCGSASASERTAAESGNIPNSLLAPAPPQGRQGGSDSERSSIAIPGVLQGQAPRAGSSAGSALGSLSCVPGWEMRSSGWKQRLEALKPRAPANQPWGFSKSGSPTWCVWMRVSSLIPDSSRRGNHVTASPGAEKGKLTDVSAQS